MYLRPALKFVELIASISTEDEMINCASTPAPWEVPFKLRVDCNTANTLGGWWRTGSAGSASRAQQWVLLPSHPCGYILELWNVLPATSRWRRYPTGYRNEGSGNYRYEYTADTDSCTKLRWLHYHQPAHVSACLGSAALRGGYDDDSILRLTRDD